MKSTEHSFWNMIKGHYSVIDSCHSYYLQNTYNFTRKIEHVLLASEQ